MENCIFCKIIYKQIQSHNIAETDDFLAFCDIYSLNKYHFLIVPKKHYLDFQNTPINLLQESMNFIQTLQKNICNKIPTIKGFKIITNQNKAAGQEINHFHWHLIGFEDNNQLLDKPRNDNELMRLTKLFS